MKYLAKALKVVGGSVLISTMLFVAGGALSTSAANAATHSGCYPPGSKSCKAHLSAHPSTLSAGGSFTLTGSGFAAGATVTINVCNLETETATANSGGTFSIKITVPSNAPSGSCAVTASGTGANGQPLTQTTTITITSSGTTIPGTHTGEPWASWLYWGGAIAAGLIGFALLGLSRRRTAVSGT
jgi:hypothetical protein